MGMGQLWLEWVGQLWLEWVGHLWLKQVRNLWLKWVGNLGWSIYDLGAVMAQMGGAVMAK